MAGKSNLKDEELNVENQEFTEEETQNQLLMNEKDIIQGLIEAADFKTDDVTRIDIVRNKKTCFSFHVRPLTEFEYDKCKKKHTKYVRNKQLGVRMPEETNSVKYRAEIIYLATIDSDRKTLWDNKNVWDALRSKDFQIMNGLDVIEYTLRAGEKDKVIEKIDLISGYESNLEEVTKN